MNEKINFNEFINERSSSASCDSDANVNLSNDLYQIVMNEICLQNKNKNTDVWTYRLENLVYITSLMIKLNKDILYVISKDILHGKLDYNSYLKNIYDFYQNNKNSNLISLEDKEKIYEFLTALPGWNMNKNFDEQPTDVFEIFSCLYIDLKNILHKIFIFE